MIMVALVSMFAGARLAQRGYSNPAGPDDSAHVQMVERSQVSPEETGAPAAGLILQTGGGADANAQTSVRTREDSDSYDPSVTDTTASAESDAAMAAAAAAAAMDSLHGPLYSVEAWRRWFTDGTFDDVWVRTHWSGFVEFPECDSLQFVHGALLAAYARDGGSTATTKAVRRTTAGCTWRCIFEDGFALGLPEAAEDAWAAIAYGSGWTDAPPVEVTSSNGKRYHLPMDAARLREDHGAIHEVTWCGWKGITGQVESAVRK